MSGWEEAYFPVETAARAATQPKGGTLSAVLYNALVILGAVVSGYVAFSLDINPTIERQAIAGFPTHEEQTTAQLAALETAAGEALPLADAGKALAGGEYQVQAVLVPKRQAVISGTMDGRVVKFPFKNGDVFEKGAVLAEYDCGIDSGRLKEVEARLRLTEAQLAAYNQLRDLEAVSKVELVTAIENNEQNKAMVKQARSRLGLCTIRAPFKGRVTNKMASQYEFVQAGRVLLEIVSREQLQAEFLIPSRWLRWLNIGTELNVYIEESDASYPAKIVRIHGEVDPVSQSVQVAAEIGEYKEELLPGMSGRAVFSQDAVMKKPNFGFLGLVLETGGKNDDQTDNGNK